MASVYDFRPGRSIKGVNPQAVGQELERIRAERGKLVPEDVLEVATDPASPLHGAFEWDDSEAARLHRLAEARKLIVSIRVLNPPTGKPMVAYLSVKTPDVGRTYMPTVEAMNDEELLVRVLVEVRQALEAIERRYAHFAEVADLLQRLKSNVA